jgi:hypothetical protein
MADCVFSLSSRDHLRLIISTLRLSRRPKPSCMTPFHRRLLYELSHALDQPDFDDLLRIQRELVEAFAARRDTLTPHLLLSISLPAIDMPRLNKLAGWLSKATSLFIEVRLREPDASAAAAPRIRRREE